MWLELALILIVCLGVVTLGSNRLGTMIQLFALQSLVLSATPLLVHPGKHAVVMTMGTLILKVFLMPNLLFWAIRHVFDTPGGSAPDWLREDAHVGRFSCGGGFLDFFPAGIACQGNVEFIGSLRFFCRDGRVPAAGKPV